MRKAVILDTHFVSIYFLTRSLEPSKDIQRQWGIFCVIKWFGSWDFLNVQVLENGESELLLPDFL